MEKKAAWTPGPWRADVHGDTFYVWGTERHMDPMVADSGDEALTIARIRGVGRGATEAEMKANARLIAASPLMYEALKEAVVTLDDGSEHCPTPDECEACIVLNRWKAALAQADGQS